MKALKAFINSFEAPQRSMKEKFNLIFISIQLSEMHGTGRVKTNLSSLYYLKTSENQNFLSFSGGIKMKCYLEMVDKNNLGCICISRATLQCIRNVTSQYSLFIPPGNIRKPVVF